MTINCYYLFPCSSLTFQISHKPSHMRKNINDTGNNDEDIILSFLKKKKFTLTQDFILVERLSWKATSFMQSSLIPLPSVTPFLPWQQSTVVKSPDWRRSPGFKSHLCYCLAVWPWASCLTSLCLSSSIRKTEVIILPIWRGFINIPWLKTYKVFKVVPVTEIGLSDC